MTITDAPLDDLYRGLLAAPEVRDEGDADSGSLMYGHFAVFDTWTEIDSWFEGRFMERLAKGSFRKTIREQRDQVKVQFDHGFDFHVGDSLLGPIDDLREDAEGPYYEVPLLDTDYNRDRVLPMLQGRLMSGEKRGSLLGASFRFRVVGETWNREPKASDHNPEALPERTIKEVRLYEFGPVVWPAYPEATAGARSAAEAPTRSLTDHYLARRLSREGRAERAARHLVPTTAGAPATVVETNAEPAKRHSSATGGRLLAAAITDIERRRSA